VREGVIPRRSGSHAKAPSSLYDRLDLPEEMNERISQEVFQLFENALQ
jgi:hypothetical protein